MAVSRHEERIFWHCLIGREAFKKATSKLSTLVIRRERAAGQLWATCLSFRFAALIDINLFLTDDSLVLRKVASADPFKAERSLQSLREVSLDDTVPGVLDAGITAEAEMSSKAAHEARCAISWICPLHVA